MKRYRGKHRVSKEDLKEDRFQQATEKVAEFYYRDKQKFWVIVGVAVAVIVGGIVLLQGRGKGDNQEAQLRFTEALGIFTQGEMQQAEEAFSNLASRHGRDWAGVRARYYLGQIYYSSQRYDEARSEFAAFLKRGAKDPVLGPGASIGLADCDSELGNHLRAAEQYRRVFRNYPDSPLAFDAMMAAGREYRLGGRLDLAEQTYQELLKTEPTGDQAEELKVQLAYVQALQGQL
ncbi:tetratricopeptide repeat protein [candidate division WOR-3 bacterium]|nr:tetratricopeptide repeat protein [candidate division WOR-3 bacterium]